MLNRNYWRFYYMKKVEFVEEVATKAGLTKADADRAVKAFEDLFVPNCWNI